MPNVHRVILRADPPVAPSSTGGELHTADVLNTTLDQRARNGDVAAFAAVVCRHQRKVQGRALAITHNAQEAMLIAWRRLDTFRGDCAFSTWIYAVVTRLALNKVTRRPVTVAQDDQHHVADPHPGPAQRVETAAATTLVRAAVNRLPAPQARAVTLHHLHGMSYAQIAHATATAEPRCVATYSEAAAASPASLVSGADRITAPAVLIRHTVVSPWNTAVATSPPTTSTPTDGR